MAISIGSAQHAEDSAAVEVLLAQSKKHEELGKKISACAVRIGETGTTLETAAGPMYNDTQQLQAIARNVDRVLAAIERYRTPLNAQVEEENILRAGLQEGGLETYLGALLRVEEKHRELMRTPMRMNQEAAKELTQMLEGGTQQLQDTFEELLRRGPEKVEPLQFITKGKPFPTFESDVAAQLADIEKFLSKQSKAEGGYQAATATVQAYADIRGQYLQRSLANLASASLTTSRRKNSEDIYRQGTSAVGTYASGLEQAIMAEWTNITLIFGTTDFGKALEQTASKALGEFARTLRELNSQIKSHITTDCFLAYEIMGIATELAFNLDKKTGMLKQLVIDAVKPIRDTARLSISELLDDVRRRVSNMMILPPDGSSLPFTAEVLTRLQAMTAYPHPLGSIMSSMGEGNWSASSNNNNITAIPNLKSFDVNPDTPVLMGNYVLDTLEALFSGLESRARAVLKQKPLIGLFIANNVAVADRMIRASELASLLAAQPASAAGKVEGWRKKGHATYLESWREPCSALMDVQYTNRGGARPPSGGAESAAIVKSLSGKDKDAIKDKFKTFNACYETLAARHRELAPHMEREVRAGLAREIAGMLEPLYGRFWERYHDVDKGKGKYVRYDKASFAAQLATLA